MKSAGPKGLFTGYFPTLIEDVPDMAFKFAAYESCRYDLRFTCLFIKLEKQLIHRK